MSRFARRIKKLIDHTHTFISHEDFCLIRDYIRLRLDEMEKPPDFEKKMRKIEALRNQLLKAYNRAVDKRIIAVVETSQAIRMKYLLPWYEAHCKWFPKGAWLPHHESESFMRLLGYAKSYFANNKRGVSKSLDSDATARQDDD